jgi:hypothetical protein
MMRMTGIYHAGPPVAFRRRLAAKDPEIKLVRGVFDNISDSAKKRLAYLPAINDSISHIR